MGSNQSGPLETASKIGKVEVHDSSRSIESATGGIANQKESVVAKAEDLVDAASDELYLDSDRSADNESYHQIAKNPQSSPLT